MNTILCSIILISMLANAFLAMFIYVQKEDVNFYRRLWHDQMDRYHDLFERYYAKKTRPSEREKDNG